ncbi:MAG: GGDEF domain-containing protein [Clostridia bacterium]|jgi:diguanylate cyclase (GGDEF)-like protein|nr:GGDEF domain-containing protein [Clostridia bacterium]
MSEKITLDKLQKNLDFFSKMYDVVRLVDPVAKNVMEYKNNCIVKTNKICYTYWKNGCICDNCISVRAYKENKSFIKLECSPNAIMLVTALPIETSEQSVVLELFKNATDSMVIGTGDYTKNQLISNVVHNINDMVIKDPLTGLYNRRFLDDRLPINIIKATVSKSPLSVIFIDINNMKTINDTYGHEAGDKSIKLVANAIKHCIRTDTDWAARYGGDEFLVCLNNTVNEDARSISKKICCDVASKTINIQGSNVSVTISSGVITMFDSALTAEEIIRLADEKMYESKKQNKKKC